ncbi:MAG: macro domain-containing protein [Firmicutes bacterium]|nr:macro domain-containing protein [Bacillota bacterium]
MPFRIIRDDITRVRADAIVNTANPEPVFSSGTDGAIYHAAGAEALLEERKKIGRIAPGEAAVTPAFRLSAKYIIHTVGPAWIDGRHKELEILDSCYRKSLLLAQQLGCESIAFPLIATGVYGFPKEHALKIALTAIRRHLESSEMDVTIVVFDRSAYQTASFLTQRVEAYIDEKYVSDQLQAEYDSSPHKPSDNRNRRIWERRKQRQSEYPAYHAAPMMEPDEAIHEIPKQSAARPAHAKPGTGSDKKTTLEDLINHLGETFQARLLRMIDESGMTDPQVYKRANIDRKLFSKIRCNESYVPKKNTILAFALALQLNLDDTKDLLSSAGLALTNNSKTDLIVRFCIENQIYDIFEVNALLFKFDQPVLG